MDNTNTTVALPLDEIDRLAQTLLELKLWGFEENIRLETKIPMIVYQSEWCRMKIAWGGWEMFGGYTISIDYGRLHASADHVQMIWNGEKCYCWHNIVSPLHFLDGHSPKDVAGQNYQRPYVMEQFIQSEVGQRLKDRHFQPEWLMRMHRAIWQHYGIRLFELFDLRRPDLWEKYCQFMKDLYDIEGRSPNIKPPLDSIC